MKIPDINEDGVLPVGIHTTTLDIVFTRYSYNLRRKEILEKMKNFAEQLKRAGGTCFYLDGSFITSREYPGDYDICIERSEISVEFKKLLFPTPGDDDYCTYEQKRMFGADIYFSDTESFFDQKENRYITMLDFFQQDSRMGIKKGILLVKI